MKHEKSRKNTASYVILTIVMIAGLSLLLYPTVAELWNRHTSSRAVDNYNAAIANLDNEEYQMILKEALAYNEKLATGESTVFPDIPIPEYNDAVRMDNYGIMGVIEIKKINVTLPIYHGTDDSVLNKAIGHLDWTSLPVGAASWDEFTGQLTNPKDGSHSVVSGHRGLPSARLFTDLGQMETGDIFALRMLDEVLTYEVDQILTVDPADLDALKIVPGKDYCTLVTCTPYSINTHRLLIRGHRVPARTSYWFTYHVQSNATRIKPAIVAIFIVAPIFVLLFLLAMIRPAFRRTKRGVIPQHLMDELVVADLPLQKLDISIVKLARMFRQGEPAKQSEAEKQEEQETVAEADAADPTEDHAEAGAEAKTEKPQEETQATESPAEENAEADAADPAE